MNVNQIIIASLSSLGLDVVPNKYDGSAEEYITFNYADERPILHADDEEQADETIVHVHYFTKTDPQPIKKTIRTLLKSAGFLISSTSELYEDDTGYTHIIVEVNYDGEIEY